MDNAKINLGTALDYALPAVSIESGDVNLFLSGSNEVQGGLGHAGIYVAEGAKLTISGDGSLLAVGGNGSRVVTLPPNMQSASSTRAYFGGGAGIGGNGLWIYSNDTWLPDSTPSFGTVVIESGDVAAPRRKSGD